MNGPQHYAEAERIRDAAVMATESPFPHLRASELLALAQLHATLANAAATAMAGINHMDEDDFREWDKVAGVQRDGE